MNRFQRTIFFTIFINALLLIQFAGNSLAAQHHRHVHNPFQVEADHLKHNCPLKHQHAGGLCPHLIHKVNVSGIKISIECGGDSHDPLPEKNNSRWAQYSKIQPHIAAFKSQLISLPTFRWDSLFSPPAERPPDTISFQI
ncbi:MAG: hypothetical protein G3M70_10950 [Candidatus Nitronauta litoralis]|uniref:Uncharacterized protein n=1 Tax=Candidatus Nitronauta litoralis TaxID=2705533 RepID=A0A7T0G0Z7_9BACT|nr:MAG: hypothetical protein G3M70_10950 [Candidatus Nitronauta litoralis]